MIARLSGRQRHGHGLAVVRQVAAAHGGRFVLRRSEQGSLAVLELPLAADGGRAGGMSRRGRAVAFLLLALRRGGARGRDRRRLRVERRPRLRPAAAGRRRRRRPRRRQAASGRRQIASALEVRRVPARFVPPGALAAPEEALGLVARRRPARRLLPARRAAAPAASGRSTVAPGLGGARRPVEISVSGADALLAAGPVPPGRRSTSW